MCRIKMPKQPEPPPPAPVVAKTDQNVQNSAEAERLETGNSVRGIISTILTSGLGAKSKASTGAGVSIGGF